MKQKLDKILTVRSLATAQDVAKLTTEKLGEAENSAYAHTSRSQQITLRPGDDLRPFDQFNIWVYADEGTSGSLSMGVNLTTRTEGLNTPDHFRSGVATKIDWTGWKKCVFPVENFLIIGCPEGWVNVDNIVIQVSTGSRLGLSGTADTETGTIGIGTIELEQRERIIGPRLTDEGLFRELNLEHAGLETVKTAVQSKDYGTAKKELLTYFQNRAELWHPFDPDAQPAPNYNRAAADRICDHYIQDQQLPQDFDWRINPIGYLD